MNKLLATLLAGLAALTIAGTVMAADNNRPQRPTQQAPTQQEQIPAQGQSNATGNTQGSPDTESTEPNPQYAAALRKCESMSGARKTECVDSAKKKFGQM